MKKIHCIYILLLFLCTSAQNVCLAQTKTIDKNKVKQLIINICSHTTKGGDHAALAQYYTETVSPYSKTGEVFARSKIGESVKKLVNKFPKYVVSTPYNFEFVNNSFPLIVKCNVDVMWEKDGVEKLAYFKKTFYITSDYKVSGFEDQELKRITLNTTTKANNNSPSETFVKGISSFVFYKPSMDDHNNGVTYQYQGRNIKIEFYFQQVGMVARLVDEFGNKTYLDYLDIIEEGYINDSEDYQNIEYVISQHDFNTDNIPEIIIAGRIKDGACVPTTVFVYDIKNDKSWNLVAPETWWDMQVIIVNNHIKVEPNHYGFTYDWSYEKGQFVDYGSY